jgi:hypothetical protein
MPVARLVYHAVNLSHELPKVGGLIQNAVFGSINRPRRSQDSLLRALNFHSPRDDGVLTLPMSGSKFLRLAEAVWVSGCSIVWLHGCKRFEVKLYQ